MCRTMAGPVLYLFASLLGLASLPTTTHAADDYDVSYVWSRNIDGVRDYRKQVAGVLGPDVAKNLKVVTRDKLIGLVYVRHGDSAGATRVAKSHTRLLRARGLDAASPIRSENWTLVGDAGASRTAAASSAVAGSSAASTTKTATAPLPSTIPPRPGIGTETSRSSTPGLVKSSRSSNWNRFRPW